MKSNYYIKNKIKFSIASFILMLSIVFLVPGIIGVEIAGLYDKYFVVKDKKFSNYTKINYNDPNPSKVWLDNISITQTDDDPLQVGKEIGMNIYAHSNKAPESLIAQFFHADLINYFTSSDSDYRTEVKKRNDVYGLQYNSMFYVKFNSSSCKPITDNVDGIVNCDFNQFINHKFTRDGNYYVQFSVKVDNKTDHYFSPEAAFEIENAKEAWLVNSFETVLQDIEDKKGETVRTLGYAYASIGIGMMISTIALFVDSIENKSKKYH